jgi:hypothetical protein
MARLLASGAALSACVACWAALGDMTRRVELHLALHAVAFGAYLLAWRARDGLGARELRFALAAAVLWRAALVAAPPLVSDDVYRYVWEGRIQHHGGNPYRWADRPEAPRWAALRDAIWEGVNHKDYTAVYPPVWQLLCRGVTAVSDSVLTMKGFLVGCELLAWAALARVLARRGLPQGRMLALAWSPLALVEIAGSGHNEAAGMLALAVALLALERGRPAASALAAGLGFGIKLLPGLVALAWARRYRHRHALVAGAVVAAAALPYLDARQGLWRSLTGYALEWRFNETAFAPLATALGHEAATAAAGVVALATALAAARCGWEPARAGLLVVVAVLMVSANVLPWYALWLLPFLALVDCPPALLFTGTVVLAYLVYPGWRAGGAWQVGWGVRALEYGPCLVAAGLWAWRRARAGRA